METIRTAHFRRCIDGGPERVLWHGKFRRLSGNGTIFKISTRASSPCCTFSALDAGGHNEDGASHYVMVIGKDGKLCGTNRWAATPVRSHRTGAASHGRWINQAQFQGPATSPPPKATGIANSGIRWVPLWRRSVPTLLAFLRDPVPVDTGGYFQVLYTFSQTNANGQNTDGADCYEPLMETSPGVFYGAATWGGTNGNGVLFRYSLDNPGVVEVVHDFSALNATGQNWDGAFPDGPLVVGPDGILYSNAEAGGANGNGSIYSVRENGHFEVLHAFSATDPITGANYDGALPFDGVVLDRNKLIGIAVYGGNGSPAGYYNSGGTLYELKLDKR